MKITTEIEIDIHRLHLSRPEAVELIQELDGVQAEEGFTLEVIKRLCQSLIEYDGWTKEDIIKEIF